MNIIQWALKDIGIPVSRGIARPADGSGRIPSQYVVYSMTTNEYDHSDDLCTTYKTFVYMNLWSASDPTEMAATIRKCMYAAGFTIQEESDKGYNQPSYSTASNLFNIEWVWIYIQDVDMQAAAFDGDPLYFLQVPPEWLEEGGDSGADDNTGP